MIPSRWKKAFIPTPPLISQQTLAHESCPSRSLVQCYSPQQYFPNLLRAITTDSGAWKSFPFPSFRIKTMKKLFFPPPRAYVSSCSAICWAESRFKDKRMKMRKAPSMISFFIETLTKGWSLFPFRKKINEKSSDADEAWTNEQATIGACVSREADDDTSRIANRRLLTLYSNKLSRLLSRIWPFKQTNLSQVFALNSKWFTFHR